MKFDDDDDFPPAPENNYTNAKESTSVAEVKALDKRTALRLRQSQVVTNQSDIVRELVENAVDANATSIQVLLVKHGLDKIEVRDNGDGLIPEDVHVAFRGGHTSKLNDTNNLTRSKWFGFRGEALNSMCAAGNVTVVTKTSNDVRATKYQLNHQGVITSENKVAHSSGTIISVEKLFQNFPVRRQRQQNANIAAAELKEIETFLKALAVANPKCHVSLYHNASIIWSKASVNSIEQALIAVLGHNISKNMEKYGPVNVVSCDDSCDVHRSMELYLPKKPVDMRTMSFTSNRLAMIFCNRKRVYIREYEKLIHRYVTAVVDKPQPADRRRFPVCVVFIKVPPVEADFNRDMDKTKVFLVHKDLIRDTIEEALMKFYEIDLSISESANSSEVVNVNSVHETPTYGEIPGSNDVASTSLKSVPKNVLDDTHLNTATPVVAPVIPNRSSAFGRDNAIMEFLQDISLSSSAFSKSPLKPPHSEPTAVTFPTSKPVFDDPPKSCVRERSELNNIPGGIDKGVRSLVSNFEISLSSQMECEEIPKPKTAENGASTTSETSNSTSIPTTTLNDWVTGRMLDKNGKLIENVVLVTNPPLPSTSDKSKDLDRFKAALFTGSQNARPARSSAPSTPLLLPFTEPPNKRFKTHSLSCSPLFSSHSSARPITPGFNTPPGSTHRQVTLDSLSKWPTPKSVFSQAASNSVVGVRLPMTPMNRIIPVNFAINHDKTPEQNICKVVGLLEEQQVIRKPCLPLPSPQHHVVQPPVQHHEQNPLHNQARPPVPGPRALTESPISSFEVSSFLSKLPDYKLSPKVNGRISFESSLGPLYFAQTQNAIGIFSPVNMVKYCPSEKSECGLMQSLPTPDEPNVLYGNLSDAEVSNLFSNFLSKPEINEAPFANKIFHTLKTLPSIANVYKNMPFSRRIH